MSTSRFPFDESQYFRYEKTMHEPEAEEKLYETFLKVSELMEQYRPIERGRGVTGTIGPDRTTRSGGPFSRSSAAGRFRGSPPITGYYDDWT